MAASWAACGDVFLNEAFSVIHRRHASVHALSGLLPAFAGRELERERQRLLHFHQHEVRRGIVLGGAKLDQKLNAVSTMAGDVDVLCLGGMTAIAVACFLGQPIGQSSFTKSCMETVGRAWNALCVRQIRAASRWIGLFAMFPTSYVSSIRKPFANLIELSMLDRELYSTF